MFTCMASKCPTTVSDTYDPNTVHHPPPPKSTTLSVRRDTETPTLILMAPRHPWSPRSARETTWTPTAPQHLVAPAPALITHRADRHQVAQHSSHQYLTVLLLHATMPRPPSCIVVPPPPYPSPPIPRSCHLDLIPASTHQRGTIGAKIGEEREHTRMGCARG
jgi:hypothetical protein